MGTTDQMVSHSHLVDFAGAYHKGAGGAGGLAKGCLLVDCGRWGRNPQLFWLGPNKTASH